MLKQCQKGVNQEEIVCGAVKLKSVFVIWPETLKT